MKRNKRGTLLIALGMLLITGAFSLTICNLGDGYKAKREAGRVMSELEMMVPGRSNTRGQDNPERSEASEFPDDVQADSLESGLVTQVEIPDYILNPDMEMPIQNIDGQNYIGILEIPDCNLELPVISDWSYPRLKIAPCRYDGSAYTDDLIVAAHNYQSHFGDLNVLQEGEEVILTDMDGNVFRYKVIEREILLPADVKEMQAGNWDLTLFTCTFGGSYRVTVRCEKYGPELE